LIVDSTEGQASDPPMLSYPEISDRVALALAHSDMITHKMKFTDPPIVICPNDLVPPISFGIALSRLPTGGSLPSPTFSFHRKIIRLSLETRFFRVFRTMNSKCLPNYGNGIGNE
jgi:hypothetical protein